MRYYQGYKKQKKSNRNVTKRYVKQNFVLAKSGYKLPLGNLSKVSRNTRNKFLITLSIMVLLGLFYLFCVSPIFTIKIINIEGNNSINQKEILSIINPELVGRKYLIFTNNNLFCLNKQTISDKITSNHLSIETVKVQRILPNRLNIKIIEKKPAITLISGNKYYYLDKDGEIFKEIKVVQISAQKGNNSQEKIIDDSELDKTVPQISNEKNSNISLGEKFISNAKIDFLQLINRDLYNVTGLVVNNFYITEPNSKELRVRIKDNGEVYFRWEKNDDSEDLTNQIARLKVLLKQMIEKDGGKFKFINLTNGEQIYYEPAK